jgi:transposase
MSSRELNRVEVMGRVGSGDLKLTDAAVMLELSYRQAKRLWRRYRQVGSKGLKHGNAGRPSNRSKPQKLRHRVLHLIRKKYSGSEDERFGPTLAAEHLAEEDGIVLDHETLRLWMWQEGLWSRQRKRKKHCQRRERKSIFGELVQLDGSFHDWLESRGPRGCLMDMVDDATNHVLARRKPSARELRETFRLETERRISNDWVIRHEGRYFQLRPAGQRGYGPTQSKALVCEWEDGSMEVYYRGQRLASLPRVGCPAAQKVCSWTRKPKPASLFHSSASRASQVLIILGDKITENRPGRKK